MAGELKAITVMYKIKDYNPADGDWFWVKYSPDGKATLIAAAFSFYSRSFPLSQIQTAQAQGVGNN
jgi:hypothetical protein